MSAAMNAPDTVLSINVKMAPGPAHPQEPVAPDKGNNNAVGENPRVDVDGDSVEETAIPPQDNELSASLAMSPDSNAQGTTTHNSASDNKQEEPATLSTLNEGELRALLDEAITYKCPKDREGKSTLFKELLQEAEADETEEGCRVIANSRCLPVSNRRRHKRDSVSERLTHGGSLQNLAQPITSEFDSSFAYLTSGSSHTYGGSKRKNKKYTGPSVSARQREGGSLPSNVNASHSLASLVNLDLIFDKKKGFSEERTAAAYDWTSKEKSKSLDKSSSAPQKKEDKEKEKRESKRDSTGGLCDSESGEVRERRGNKGKYGTNEMLESDNPPPEYKSDYTVIDLSDVEVGALSERNVVSSVSNVQQQRAHSLDAVEDEGTEMKIIEPRRQFIARANVDITQTPVDTTIKFPICEHNGKQEKSKISVNGTEVSSNLPFQTYNSAKCVIGGTANNTTNSSSQGKGISSLCSMMPASWQIQSSTMEGARCATQYAIKDTASSGEKKSLDENGNAVQGYNGERRKRGKKHTQEPNVLVYNAESIEGHRGRETDIERLLNFIENRDSKGKKKKTGNSVRVKSTTGTKPRTREKDKREQLPAKLQKSNSLEEISKTKLQDLTTEKSVSSSGASSISSQHGTINVALRRAKQKSTGDPTVDSRGDRRSWGTEEGQSIYCNDTGDDYATRRNLTKKVNPEPETEPDFLIVTKKKKTKKQRRSSSGNRTQTLSTAGSYLQNSRGFSNEYRTPLSPELRRKSASSMPPSDKSDSSDLDSVHSLPVTSNTSKHNLSKTPTSSGGTPQASYADIARMATMNMSHSSVLNMPVIVPSMLNTSSWPSVPPRTPVSQSDKPQDYYPSLDELQHSDRKLKQHNFAHSNHVHNVGLAFEKPSSPPLSKMKNSAERKKAEAQEEAINKNMQVYKYVQDIEKMQRSLTQQEQKLPSTPVVNCNANSNEVTPTNAVTPKTTSNSNPSDSDNNNPNSLNNNNTNSSHNNKENVKVNSSRIRRNYIQNIHNTGQNQSQQEDMHFKKSGYQNHEENAKKVHNAEATAVQSEVKSGGQATTVDDNESHKAKASNSNNNNNNNNSKSTLDSQNNEVDPVKTSAKVEKSIKTVKESGKVTVTHHQNTKQNESNQNENQSDVKKMKQSNTVGSGNEQSHKDIQTSTKRNSNSSRPAVILLDETSSDFANGSDLQTELTFGFEVNEQLLLSEDSEETAANSQAFPGSIVPSLLDKPPSNFDRPPPLYDKHIRYDKFPPNFHMQPPNAHIAQQAVHSVIVPSLPYIGYPTRFPPAPTFLPPPPPPPPGIMEKYNHQPKEDFSMLYVAPEEDVNIQNYNHDKIVSFVGLAWDAVMRETAETGRIQYYSGQ